MLLQLLAPFLVLCASIHAVPLVSRAEGAGVSLGGQSDTPEEIVKALKKAEIIPDVLPSFAPKVSLGLTYPHDHTNVELGNTIPVPTTAKPPVFNITFLKSGAEAQEATPTEQVDKTLTLVLSDPDATSRADPVKGQMCHWILGGIKFKTLNDIITFPLTDTRAYTLDMSEAGQKPLAGTEKEASALEELIKYMQPAPPPKTGKHRYVFVLLEAEKGRKDIPLKKPSDRPHWGYQHIGQGVMDWAEDNGLVPIGNFESIPLYIS